MFIKERKVYIYTQKCSVSFYTYTGVTSKYCNKHALLNDNNLKTGQTRKA